MATTQGKELWRARVERLLATDMSVSEWCAANRVSESATYRWLGVFADTEPELFGGAQNIADRDRNAWLVKTRENMREPSAPIVPAGQGFVRVDVASLAACAGPGPVAAAPAITVSIGPAVVSVPAGSAAADVARVLEAVSRLFAEMSWQERPANSFPSGGFTCSDRRCALGKGHLGSFARAPYRRAGYGCSSSSAVPRGGT